jgi:hypothetical protein
MDKVTIGLKVSEQLKAKLLELSAKEHRNLSSWMLNAMVTYAKKYQNIDISKLAQKEYEKK